MKIIEILSLKLKTKINVAALFLSLLPVQVLALDKTDTCDQAISQSTSFNAAELWKGAMSCAEQNKKREANFLILTGQIRASTDLNLLKPVNDEEGLKTTDLAMGLYYKFGGSGYPEVYQDKAEVAQLIHELEQWQVNFDQGYHPSWQYKPSVDAGYYNKMIVCQKAVRVSKLNWYIALAQNQEYQKLQRQLDKLEVDHPEFHNTNTEAYKRYIEIRSKMSAIADQIPEPDGTPEVCDFIEPFKPDPDASFKQIYTGFNAPKNADTPLFLQSEAEVRDSWLAGVIDKNILDKLLKDIDFDKQLLAVTSFGQRKWITGTVHITDVDFNTVYKTSTINSALGVHEHGCHNYQGDYYPFALAVADKPPFEITESGGYYHQNFPDECQDGESK